MLVLYREEVGRVSVVGWRRVCFGGLVCVNWEVLF